MKAVAVWPQQRKVEVEERAAPAIGSPTAARRGQASDPWAQLVECVGATYVSSADVPTSDLAARLGDIDLIYEAAGASQLAFDTVEQLGPNGVFIFTGVPGRKHRIQVAGDAIMRQLVLRNQTVLGTVNAGRVDFESAARDLNGIRTAWPGVLEKIITSRYPMGEFCRHATDGHGVKDVIAVSPE